MKTKIVVLLSLFTFATLAQTNIYTAFVTPSGAVITKCSNHTMTRNGEADYYVSATSHWFSTTQTNHMISFTNSSALIQYISDIGRSGCSNNVVTWNDVLPTEKYVFTIYWPTNTVIPTNLPVPLTAVGFTPSTNTP